MMKDVLKEIELNEPFLLLCPNQRLQKTFRYQILEETVGVGFTESILSIDTWILKLFNELQKNDVEHKQLRLLSPVEHAFIWEEIIESDPQTHQLLFTQATCELLISAFEQCILWGTHPENYTDQHYFGKDQNTFIQWKNRFENVCHERKLLTPALLFKRVFKAIESDQVELPGKIFFYGFEQANPMQTRLFETLIGKTSIKKLGVKSKAPLPQKYISAHQDFSEEVRKAALWAKKMCDEDPHARIAIIIPSLNTNRHLIEQILKKTLHDEHCAPNRFHKGLCYTISSGDKLQQFPGVKAATQLLSFLNEHLTEDYLLAKDLILLIENPLLFQFLDYQARKLITQKLRSLKGSKISKKRFLEILHDCTQTSDEINKVCNLLENPNAMPKTLNEWALSFFDMLHVSGWYYKQELNSFEFQVIQKFHECLKALSRFKNSSKNNPENFTFSQALKLLISFTTREIFQTEDPLEHKKQIHVLGILEADGQDFTHIWLCEMSDETWPPAAKPNPFLPVQLQQELDMPHASPERELRVSKALISNLTLHCMKTLIFSYSKLKDGKEIQLSHCVKGEQKLEAEDLPASASIEEQILVHGQTEHFNDFKTLPLAHDGKIEGGQGILQHQAQCAFSAFAKYRLKTEPLSEPPTGVNALERGNILHRVLDLVWDHLKSQSSLLSLSDKELIELINDKLNKVSFEFYELKNSFPVAFQLEIDRARSIAFDFLQKDKLRENFQIAKIEGNVNINLNGLKLKLRADRIDKLDSGRTFIIDYKSSSKALKSLMTPRIEEPQLPLYLLHDENTDGVAWVCLNQNEDELGYNGLADEEILPQLPDGISSCEQSKLFESGWKEQKAFWKKDLEESAMQFLNGENLLNPKNDSKTCEYCSYSSICRINDVRADRQ